MKGGEHTLYNKKKHPRLEVLTEISTLKIVCMITDKPDRNRYFTSILHSLIAKHSCGMNEQHVILALQADIVPFPSV